jgi:hypothetical protein
MHARFFKTKRASSTLPPSVGPTNDATPVEAELDDDQQPAGEDAASGSDPAEPAGVPEGAQRIG